MMRTTHLLLMLCVTMSVASCTAFEQPRDAEGLGSAAAAGLPVAPPRGTPLIAYVSEGDFAATLKQLDEAPSDLNKPERITQLSPLHYAAGTDDAGLTVLLLERGAKVDALDNTGMRPLHHAAEQGALRTIPVLLAYGAELDAQGGVNEETPLQFAAMAGQPEAALFLLERGAALTARDRRGLTPLHTSALFGRTDIVTLLLDRGAPLEEKSRDGWTPLHLAACRGHADATAALLERGALVNAIAGNGSTPLICAAENGDAATLRVLLNNGADVTLRGALFSEQQPMGWTALHVAASRGMAEAVEVLLKANSDLAATTADGKTAHELARDNNHSELATRLMK